MEIDFGRDCFNRPQTTDGGAQKRKTEMTSSAEKFRLLLSRGTGHKRLDDDLFGAVDGSLKVYRRQGIFEIEEQLDEPGWVSGFQSVRQCLEFLYFAAAHYWQKR